MRVKITVGLALLALAIAAILILFPRKTAPEVRFATVSGEEFSTSSLRGKVVLVNFWATYCASCLQEMPKLVEAHAKFAPRGLETIAVAVPRDSSHRVVQYSAHLPFKIALDTSGEVAKGFGNVRVTPTTFLIDRQGRIVRRFIGEPNWTEFHQLVELELDS